MLLRQVLIRKIEKWTANSIPEVFPEGLTTGTKAKAMFQLKENKKECAFAALNPINNKWDKMKKIRWDLKNRLFYMEVTNSLS